MTATLARPDWTDSDRSSKNEKGAGLLCGGGYGIANALVAFRPCQSFRTRTFAPPAMLIEETGPQMLVFVLEHGLSFQHPCASRTPRQGPADAALRTLAGY